MLKDICLLFLKCSCTCELEGPCGLAISDEMKSGLILVKEEATCLIPIGGDYVMEMEIVSCGKQYKGWDKSP